VLAVLEVALALAQEEVEQVRLAEAQLYIIMVVRVVTGQPIALVDHP